MDQSKSRKNFPEQALLAYNVRRSGDTASVPKERSQQQLEGWAGETELSATPVEMWLLRGIITKIYFSNRSISL